MLDDLLSRWPLIQQIRTGADGTGPESMSGRTRNLRTKHHVADVTRSICPYCGVGCGQLVYHKNGELISIEATRNRLFRAGVSVPKARTHTNCIPILAA